MTNIESIFSLKQLFDADQAGYIRLQKHPDDPTLHIANYTEKAQYENVWDVVTRNCRGLIFNDAGEILARPYPKFFNYGDDANTGPLDFDARVIVTDKLDGSLGISYIAPDGLPAIATRGSFTSEQALHATALLRDRYPIWRPLLGLTYLFEIIYPQNRIVVDYGECDELILHGAVLIDEGGVCIPDYLGWPGPIVRTFPYRSLAEALAVEPRPNAEGLVVRYTANDLMVKIKQEDYVALHALITNASARTIWRHLAVNDCAAAGLDVKRMTRLLHLDPAKIEAVLAVGDEWLPKMLDRVPDEFYTWVRQTTARLSNEKLAKRTATLSQAAMLSSLYPDDRKSLAKHALTDLSRDDAGLVFGHLDGYTITAQLWMSCYPGDERPFARTEAVA